MDVRLEAAFAAVLPEVFDVLLREVLDVFLPEVLDVLLLGAFEPLFRELAVFAVVCGRPLVPRRGELVFFADLAITQPLTEPAAWRVRPNLRAGA